MRPSRRAMIGKRCELFLVPWTRRLADWMHPLTLPTSVIEHGTLVLEWRPWALCRPAAVRLERAGSGTFAETGITTATQTKPPLVR